MTVPAASRGLGGHKEKQLNEPDLSSSLFYSPQFEPEAVHVQLEETLRWLICASSGEYRAPAAPRSPQCSEISLVVPLGPSHYLFTFTKASAERP